PSTRIRRPPWSSNRSSAAIRQRADGMVVGCGASWSGSGMSAYARSPNDSGKNDSCRTRRNERSRSPVRRRPSPFNSATRSDRAQDRKSTRLNSSHVSISYAVFCLKKKTHTLGEIALLWHLAGAYPHSGGPTAGTGPAKLLWDRLILRFALAPAVTACAALPLPRVL